MIPHMKIYSTYFPHFLNNAVNSLNFKNNDHMPTLSSCKGSMLPQKTCQMFLE